MMLLKLLSGPNEYYHRSAVVSLMDGGELGGMIRELGVPVHCLGMRQGRPKATSLVSLWNFVRKYRPDLVQGWMSHGNLVATLASYLTFSRTPIVWNVRQALYDPNLETRTTALAIRTCALLSRRPAAIIYNSCKSAEQHEQFGYDCSRRVIIPNGFDCSLFRPNPVAYRDVRAELGIPVNAPIIGIVANYHPIKGHAVFLQAAAQFASRDPRVYFVMVGRDVNANEGIFRSASQDPILGARLRLLGERRDVATITAAFDVACSTSWSEAFSNALGEAMACGVPCVASDVGDSRHLVGNCGVLFPAGDCAALLGAWERLLKLPEAERRQLGIAARRRIEENFSLSTVQRQYAILHQRCVKGHTHECGRQARMTRL